MSKDILSIFEKHLGKHSNSSSPIANIKDINHLIGILQTLDIALKKCQTHIQDAQQISQIINQCLFAGEKLFDKDFHLSFCQKTFRVDDISSLLQKQSQDEITAYIQNKRSEISNLLDMALESIEEKEEHFSDFSTQGRYLHNVF